MQAHSHHYRKSQRLGAVSSHILVDEKRLEKERAYCAELVAEGRKGRQTDLGGSKWIEKQLEAKDVKFSHYLFIQQLCNSVQVVAGEVGSAHSKRRKKRSYRKGERMIAS